MVLKSLQFTALFFFGKGIMAVLVKSSGHFSSSYISLQISQSSCVALSPRLFNISDGLSSTPAAFPSFISDIANNISLFNTSGPATSSSTSSLSSEMGTLNKNDVEVVSCDWLSLLMYGNDDGG